MYLIKLNGFVTQEMEIFIQKMLEACKMLSKLYVFAI